MNFSQELDPKAKARKKFYSKIRSQFTNFDTSLREPTRQNELLDGEAFGQITKQELESIINRYEEQQSSTSLKDKPVICDQVTGGSYSKLLFSKEGFHNPGSTLHLINNLRIIDTTRNSFLAGHSTYADEEGNSLDDIHKRQQRMYIKENFETVTDLLDKNRIKEAEAIFNELNALEAGNPDVTALRGRFLFIMKEFDKAISEFKRAIQCECSNQPAVRKQLSEALCQLGHRYYIRQEYQKAWQIFSDSLVYDKDNKNSEVHIGICRTRLAEKYRPFGTYRDDRYKYRK